MDWCHNYLWCLCIIELSGIHGPSIVEPAIAAITYANIEANFKLLQAGEHADKIITSGTQMFIVTFGGTGATLVVPFMFMWMTKSKRNRKTNGRASVVPQHSLV